MWKGPLRLVFKVEITFFSLLFSSKESWKEKKLLMLTSRKDIQIQSKPMQLKKCIKRREIVGFMALQVGACL